MSFESRRGSNKRKKENMFCKYEFFFLQLSLVFLLFQFQNKTWAMRAKLMNLFNHQRKQGFDYVCFNELFSIKFQLYNFSYILIRFN